MNKLFTFLVLTLVICLSSCSSDDDDNRDNDVKKRIVKLDFSPVSEEAYNFTYDSAGRLSILTEVVPSTNWLHKLSYDTQGKLIRMESSSDNLADERSYIIFEHKKDSIIANLYDNDDEPVLIWADTLLLNNKGQVTRMQDGEYIYTYKYDNNGNLTSAYYGNSLLGEYTYNNTKSIFLNMNAPSWIWIYFGEEYLWGFAGPNSMKGWSDYEYSVKFDYKLDNDGYPSEIYNDDEKEALISYQTIE